MRSPAATPVGPVGRPACPARPRRTRAAWPAALAILLLAAPARADERGVGSSWGAFDDDDDPKRDRSSAANPRRPDWEHLVSVKLTYRYFIAENLDRSALPFHGAQLDLYPISMKWFRVGIEAAMGHATGQLTGREDSAWFLTTGLNMGVQYPMRFTPFVDVRFAAGFIGGDVVGQGTALSWMWVAGLEAGCEVFVTGRFFLTAAIGWVHPLYHGIDLAYSMANPQNEPRYVDISNDSFTLKVGLGF